MSRRDHYTNTEHDAGRFERFNGPEPQRVIRGHEYDEADAPEAEDIYGEPW